MKRLMELLKVLPFPWDYIFYLFNIKNMMQINDNKNIDNIIKILVAFFCTLYMLEFLVSKIIKLNIVTMFNGEQLILFFIHLILPISVIYSLVIYVIVYKKSPHISNLLSLFIQAIKFFTLALIPIGLVLAIAINVLFVDNINILESQNEFDKSSYNFILSFLLVLFISTFIVLIIIPTNNFLIEKNIKYPKIFLISIILVVLYINNTLNAFDLLPKISISSLINKEVFCKEISEIKIIENVSCESSKSKILEFRTNCINSLNFK